jgi:hypothetical protein
LLLLLQVLVPLLLLYLFAVGTMRGFSWIKRVHRLHLRGWWEPEPLEGR